MKKIILRLAVLVAMASAAVTMNVHTKTKEVQAASRKGQQVVKYAKKFVGNLQEVYIRSLERAFLILQVHREDMVRK